MTSEKSEDQPVEEVQEPARRTKRRYAHELYPHGEPSHARPLEVEVPYLYSRAMGLEIQDTGWFKNPGKEANDRIMRLIDARMIALQADAMLQGLTGNEAWSWVVMRAADESGEWAWERAEHYGVEPEKIKPYPCGPEPEHHDHFDNPDGRRWGTVTQAPGAESACIDCTEPIMTHAAKNAVQP